MDDVGKKVRVIFRKFKNGEVIAIFPDMLYDYSPGGNNVCSYQHVGQHGKCDYSFVLKKTKLAIEPEYLELYKELVDLVGYDDLVIVKRR